MLSFKNLYVLVFLFVFSLPTMAQFTDDPAVNTPIANTSGVDQVLPKIVTHADGTSYISWFQNNSGYDVYMQRIDAEGNKLWGDEGILIASRGFSSTQDYGLSIDSDGNAVIIFRDDRFGGERVTVNRIAPDGEHLWGTNGVQITTDGFINAPNVTVASNNTIVAGYTGEGFVGITALDTSGDILWTANQSVDGANLALSDIKASDTPGQTGQVIVMMQTFGAPTVPRRLYAQKINASGANVWGASPVQIMTDGTLQFGNFPDFIVDGNGGMFVAWYVTDPGLNVRVQGIRNDGSLYFASNGILVSDDTSRLRVNPDLVFSESDESLYVFWIELNSNQSQSGLYVQKLNKDGNRQWGSQGVAMIPLSPGAPAFTGVYAQLFGSDPVVFYTRNTTSVTEGHIRAARINSVGQYIWHGNFIAISDIQTAHSRLNFSKPRASEMIITWQAGSTPGNVFAQNLNADGTLGSVDSEANLVTFRVDMSVQEFQENFIPQVGDKVFVRGSFSDFALLNENEMTLIEDSVYEVTLDIEGNPGDTFEYKFFIEAGDGRTLPNTGWEDNVGPGENGNRVFDLAGREQELPLVFFNNEDEKLGSFNPLTPPVGSTFELNPDGDEMLVFTWEESIGADFYYVEFRPNFEGVTTNWFYDSDEDGSTTQLTISESVLANLVLNTNTGIREGTMEWLVYSSRDGEERESETSFTFEYTVLSPASVTDPVLVPQEVQLHQNYPNPFNPTTQIQFELPNTTNITLEVFNPAGQRVAMLANGTKQAGRHTVQFDGTNLSSGLYVYRLQTGNEVITRKMLLVK